MCELISIRSNWCDGLVGFKGALGTRDKEPGHVIGEAYCSRCGWLPLPVTIRKTTIAARFEHIL